MRKILLNLAVLAAVSQAASLRHKIKASEKKSGPSGWTIPKCNNDRPVIGITS